MRAVAAFILRRHVSASSVANQIADTDAIKMFELTYQLLLLTHCSLILLLNNV